MNIDLKSAAIKRTFLAAAVFILGLFFIIRYAGLVLLYALDVPTWDDFDIHLNFVLKYIGSSSLPERIFLVFERNGEHFVLTNKLLSLVDWGLEGRLNFRSLILMGNAALAAAAAALFVLFKPAGRRRPVLFLPVIIAIFQPQYAQSITWASGAIQHFWIFAWVLGFFVFAKRPGITAKVPAGVCAFMACFSQGNGALALLAYSLVCLARRERLNAIAWFIPAAGVLFLLSASPGSGTDTGISLTRCFYHSLTFLGSGFSAGPFLAACLGAVCLLAFFLLLNRGLLSINPEIGAVVLWLILTAAANAYARSALGIHYAYDQTRYRLPSLVFMASLYLAAQSVIPACRMRLYTALICGLSFFVTSIRSYEASRPELTARRQDLEESVLRWQFARTGLSYPKRSQPHAVSILEEADRKNIFRLPALDTSRYLSGELVPVPFDRALLNDASAGRKLVNQIEFIRHEHGRLMVSGFAFPRKQSFADHEVFLLLSNAEELHAYKSFPRLRPDVSAHFHRDDVQSAGFLAIIDTSSLRAPSYELTIVFTAPEIQMISKTHSINGRLLADDEGVQHKEN